MGLRDPAHLCHPSAVNDCIFCQIVVGRGELATSLRRTITRLLSSSTVDAATEGHTIVVPRTHAIDIWDIPQAEAAAVMVMRQRPSLNPPHEKLNPEGLSPGPA